MTGSLCTCVSAGKLSSLIVPAGIKSCVLNNSGLSFVLVFVRWLHGKSLHSDTRKKRSFKAACSVGAMLSSWLRVRAVPEGVLQKPGWFVGLCLSGGLGMSRDIAAVEVRSEEG